MSASGPASSNPAYHASDGAAYERFLGRWTARLAGELVSFARLPAEGAVLDVGCGTGSLTAELAHRYPGREIHGLDRAEPYIAFARDRVPASGATFYVNDALNLPFADRTMTGALAQLVLNFVSDPAAAAREMRRVLRPGGVAVAAVWDFRGGLVYQRLFWDTAAAFDPGAAVARDRLFAARLALPDGLTDLWRGAGFAEIERGSLTIRMDYADFDDYWEPLLGGQGPVGTYVTALDSEKRATIREHVRKAYLAGAPDGARSLTATAWAVRGLAP